MTSLSVRWTSLPPLAAALLAACSPPVTPSNIDSAADGGTTPGQVLGGHCTQGSDCASTDCFTSAPGGICTTDCSNGQACASGFSCESVGGSASDCLADCSTTTDCRNGYQCTNGACTPACTANSDCTVTQHCDTTSGLCVSTTGCHSNTDCTSPEVCDTGSGDCTTPSTGCTSDAACGADMTCNTATGVCTPTTPAGCTSNASCGANMTCNTATGVCSPTTPTGCTSNASCGSNMTCNTTTGVCSANTSGTFTTVPLSGCAFVGYNTPVSVGGDTFTFSIDTGSTTMAVADTTCGAGCDASPEFSPTSSSLGAVSAEYGSGSWVGKIYSDSVQVGPEMPAVTMDFAGIDSQSEFFLQADCSGNMVADSLSQGILGMGPLTLSEIMMNNPVAADAYFSELVAHAGIANEFAVQLCSSGGNMWFGGYDPSYATGTPQYTPIVSTDGYYAVNITSAGLGGTALGGTWGQSVVDTGTWGFLMPTAAYTKFVSTIAANAATTTLFSGANALSSAFWKDGNCVSPDSTSTTRADIDATLPPLTLVMPQVGGGSFTLSLPASSSYLITQGSGSSAQYCAGVSNNTGIGIIIMGAAAQAANITIFDPGSSQIGFVSGSNCPQ